MSNLTIFFNTGWALSAVAVNKDPGKYLRINMISTLDILLLNIQCMFSLAFYLQHPAWPNIRDNYTWSYNWLNCFLSVFQHLCMCRCSAGFCAVLWSHSSSTRPHQSPDIHFPLPLLRKVFQATPPQKYLLFFLHTHKTQIQLLKAPTAIVCIRKLQPVSHICTYCKSVCMPPTPLLTRLLLLQCVSFSNSQRGDFHLTTICGTKTNVTQGSFFSPGHFFISFWEALCRYLPNSNFALHWLLIIFQLVGNNLFIPAEEISTGHLTVHVCVRGCVRVKQRGQMVNEWSWLEELPRDVTIFVH